MTVFTPNNTLPPIHRIERFRGLNLAVDPTQLAFNESPFMQNMFLDLNGIPNKRSGYKKVFATSLGAGQINGMFSYRKTDGSLVRIVHHGTKLYTWDDSGSQPTQIYASMNNAKSNAFTMNGIFYIFDRVNYLQYNGTTVSAVVGYIPATRISAAPDGTNGVANESPNLISGLFENWFTGNGSATAYKLSLSGLDATALVASTDFGANYNKVEGTDFTVNRTTGTVTWTVAPPTTADANNVRIRASKTGTGNAAKILQSAGSHLFGGSNDTRVWVWNKHILYRSGTLQPNYWPDNGFQTIGTESEYIMGMVTQYGNAVIYKTYSIWLMQVNDDGTSITYPTQPLNDAVGCQAPASIQIVNNTPVSLTDTGLYMLTGSNVRDERNVSPQSKRVNRDLLAEASLANAVSADTGTMYILCLNGGAYVWDYEQPQQDVNQLGEWYQWTNIPASCFYSEGTKLYMGDNANGLIYRFTDESDINDQYQDDGQIIDARWRSKIEYLGTPERLKTISTIWITIQPYTRTSADIYYFDQDDVSTFIDAMEKSRFSYETFSYVGFSYITSTLPQTDRFKAKVKKVQTFQLEIRNNKLNERLGILSTQWQYEYKSKYK